MDSDIHIEALCEPTDDEIRAMLGAIVHTPVGGTAPPEGVSWLDLFRFARVLSVTLSRWQSRDCPSCAKEPARFKLEVEWEAGYESPDGNVLCEHWVDGVVKNGHDHIPFGDSEALSDNISISTTYDLKKDVNEENGFKKIIVSGRRALRKRDLAIENDAPAMTITKASSLQIKDHMFAKAMHLGRP